MEISSQSSGRRFRFWHLFNHWRLCFTRLPCNGRRVRRNVVRRLPREFNMKTFTVVCSCLMLVGCSAISELHYLGIDLSSTGWQKVTQSYSSPYSDISWDEFHFKGNMVTVITRPEISLVWHHRMTWQDGNWSWVGPTPLPIIPLWLDTEYEEKSAKQGNLRIEISVTSKESSSTIRLCDTKVTFFDSDSSGNSYVTSVIEVGPKEQPDVINLSSKEKHFTIDFELSYLKILKSIDSLAFDFPSVQGTQGSEVIPRLVFKKGHRTKYFPFLIGG